MLLVRRDPRRRPARARSAARCRPEPVPAGSSFASSTRSSTRSSTFHADRVTMADPMTSRSRRGVSASTPSKPAAARCLAGTTSSRWPRARPIRSRSRRRRTAAGSNSSIFTLFFAWLTRTQRLEKRGADGRGIRLRQLRDRRVVALRQHALLRRHGRAARRPRPSCCSRCISRSIRRWRRASGRSARVTRATAPQRRRTAFLPTWHGALAFASAWALGEWLRGTVFTGFPWLASGYAQVDGPFAGFAPMAGVYGVGWMLALVAALLVQAVLALLSARRPDRAPMPAATATARTRVRASSCRRDRAGAGRAGMLLLARAMDRRRPTRR